MKVYHDKEWLERMYWDEELSTRQMGRLAGVDGKTIHAQMVKHGVPRRNDKLKGFDTYKDREWLYQRYVVEQLSTISIAEMTGCCRETIASWLRKFDIRVRDPNELRFVDMSDEQIAEAARLYDGGWSLTRLMEKYDVSQGVLQRRLDGLVEYRPQNRQYNINERVFDDLSDERAAYFAGFLFADGGLCKTVLQVGLAMKDRCQIEKLRDFLECGNPIFQIEQNGRAQPRFYCSGVHLSERLRQLGVSNNIGGLETLERELTKASRPHWLRGFHDGDGSATKRGTLSFCGKEKALEFVRGILDPIVGEDESRSIYQHQSRRAFYLVYGKGYPARLVAQYMYENATIFLERKWRVVKDIWKWKSPGSVPDCAK